jgi:tetratricopeptide (TPR) repeat protein
MAVAPAVAEGPTRLGASSDPLGVRVGQAEDMSHIEFPWAGGSKMSARRDGQKLILDFSRAAKPDISRLRTAPPKYLKGAEVTTAGRGLELILTLADDADATSGFDDGVNYVNLFHKADAPPPSDLPALPSPSRPDPVPSSGVVVAQAMKSGPQVAISFPWKAPLGAAVFRRGPAIWIVFDARARMDMQAVARAAPQYALSEVEGPDYVALKIAVPLDIPFSAAAEGGTWTVILGPGAQARSLQIAMGRAGEDGPPALAANLAGATRIIWLDDPVAGDRLAVATALGPAKGVLLRRSYVDLAALPSAQGLVIEPAADNLDVSTDGDVVRISKPNGLVLSPPVRIRLAADLPLPQPAAMPGLIDFEQWSKTGGAFMDRYDGLMAAVSVESNRQALGDKSAGIAARMGLARFLVGSELAFEAIGVLNMNAKAHPELLGDAEFRGLRGAAEVMARRYKEAQADFSAPGLANDPASALWRGYAAAQIGDWTQARQEFQNGGKAMPLFTPTWRARFARANADASLRLNDFINANNQVTAAMKIPEVPLERLATLLVFARMLEAEGSGDRALPVYDAITRAPYDKLAAPALLHATQIRLYEGKISPDKAADTFESLKYRWRGDSTELEIVHDLGQLYLAQGRYRDALEALNSARRRLNDLPEAVQISDDLSTAFRNLFLNGQADGLEPIQALGLFYDFKDLTPIGADGDEMVRRLAQRLVNVDLLDQAAMLLKYQVDSRLDGVPKAQVATDLAIVQLMGRAPQGALDALNSSRTTLLPQPLQTQRRLIEARAWLQLNQLDHADEILGNDASPEGVSLHAEIAWRRRDWPTAAKIFEQSLGDRWKIADGLLAPEDESKLLRAAVAFSLAKDDASLARLRDRYQGFVDKSRWPDALKVALSGVNVEQITTANFTQAISDDQAFAGWTNRMKQRFRQAPLGGPTPNPVLRPITTADAAPATTVAADKGAKPAPPKTAKS